MAVDQGHNLYYWNNDTRNLQQIPDIRFVKVGYDGNFACAVDVDGNIWTTTQSDNVPKKESGNAISCSDTPQHRQPIPLRSSIWSVDGAKDVGAPLLSIDSDGQLWTASGNETATDNITPAMNSIRFTSAIYTQNTPYPPTWLLLGDPRNTAPSGTVIAAIPQSGDPASSILQQTTSIAALLAIGIAVAVTLRSRSRSI